MHLRHHVRKLPLAVLILVSAVVLLQGQRHSTAADLNNRSVRVSTSRAGATTQHTFRFDINTAGSLGSITFEYCSNSPLDTQPCTPPVGLDLNSATLQSQSGQTGFSISPASTNNRIILTRTISVAPAGMVQYMFDNVVNPTSASQSYFVRLATYASDDATGSVVDRGSVVFVTSGELGTQAYVPPYLTFCVGVTVSLNCSAASGNSLDLGELSTKSPRTATSQFSVATNDVAGCSIFILATTLTSGNNIIPAVAAPTPSQTGISQFGLNLRFNSTPASGQDPAGVGSVVPAANYGTPNLFAFQGGSLLASSPVSTDFKLMTISYLTNVANSQAPGVYATTATFLATAQF